MESNRTDAPPIAVLLFRALHFAARKHRDQRRKGPESEPYINHPIEVADLLARHGVLDPVTLQAAILHDTLEDTDTAPEEIEEVFGREVREVVEEVSDDKRLPWQERRRLQVEHAPALSARAKLVKIADKVSNVRGIAHSPPPDWSLERRRRYLQWTEQVVAGCRGQNAELERLYDEALREGKHALDRAGSGPRP